MFEIKYRKLYRKPLLKDLGDLRSLTLSYSPGGSDSGGSFKSFKSPIPRQPGGFPEQPGVPPSLGDPPSFDNAGS